MNSKILSGRPGRWTAGASVVAAIVASACCWLPLLALSFGVSAAGISAGFEKARPFFLIAAAALLGAGFYLSYFRKETCAPDEPCAAPNLKIKRFNRGMLWVATIITAAIALFPNYVGVLAANRSSGSLPSQNSATADCLTLSIEGMTCAACAITIQNELGKVPGVQSALVSYSDAKATVVVDPTSPPSSTSLVAAVRQAGYQARMDSETR